MRAGYLFSFSFLGFFEFWNSQNQILSPPRSPSKHTHPAHAGTTAILTTFAWVCPTLFFVWAKSKILWQIWFDTYYGKVKASQVAQCVKNLLAVQEIQEPWVQSLRWEDLLEEDMVTHSSILAWTVPIDRGVWQATVHSVTKSRTGLKQLSMHTGTWEGKGWYSGDMLILRRWYLFSQCSHLFKKSERFKGISYKRRHSAHKMWDK